MSRPAKHFTANASNMALLVTTMVIAASAFAVVGFLAWHGRLGIPAAALFLTSGAAFYTARRFVPATSLARLDTIAKTLLTIVGIVALLRHPIEVDERTVVPIYQAILDYVDQVDGRTFVAFAILAMAVKFVGVKASAYVWHHLLIGQVIRFPFWSQTVTAF
jgi:hypothetical protein